MGLPSRQGTETPLEEISSRGSFILDNSSNHQAAEKRLVDMHSPLVFISAAEEPWGAEKSMAVIISNLPDPDRVVEVWTVSDSVADFFDAHLPGDVTVRRMNVQGSRLQKLVRIDQAIRRLPRADFVLFSLYLAPVAMAHLFSPTRRFHLDLHDAPKALVDRLVVRFSTFALASVVSISAHSLDSLWLKVGKRNRIVRRPIDVEVSTVESRDTLREVAIAGRIDAEKEIEVAVAAISGTEDLVLSVYGAPFTSLETDYFATLTETARNLLGDRVVFPGRVLTEEIYKSTDVLVVANRNEPNGRTIGEAMARGVPVIVPRTGGAAENVEHDFDGLKFDSGSSMSLREQLLRLRNDGFLRERLIANAKKTVAARSPEAAGRAYLEAIDSRP